MPSVGVAHRDARVSCSDKIPATIWIAAWPMVATTFRSSETAWKISEYVLYDSYLGRSAVT